jgi:hypothetical protein
MQLTNVAIVINNIPEKEILNNLAELKLCYEKP